MHFVKLIIQSANWTRFGTVTNPNAAPVGHGGNPKRTEKMAANVDHPAFCHDLDKIASSA
jgi:hypothetical protein